MKRNEIEREKKEREREKRRIVRFYRFLYYF